jgi:hypothetical protein
MGNNFESLLDELCEARETNYRSDPERHEVMQKTLYSVVHRMLEKLSDLHDRR